MLPIRQTLNTPQKKISKWRTAIISKLLTFAFSEFTWSTFSITFSQRPQARLKCLYKVQLPNQFHFFWRGLYSKIKNLPQVLITESLCNRSNTPNLSRSAILFDKSIIYTYANLFWVVYLQFARLKTSKSSTFRISSRKNLTTRHHFRALWMLWRHVR